MKLFSAVLFSFLTTVSGIHPQGNKAEFTTSYSDTAQKEATVATSVDGQVLFTYKNEKGIGNLYITKLNGNQWSNPELLNKPINSQGCVADESISMDGNTMYFTSNRAGGIGGKDIYSTKKLPDGDWGKAENLGPVINSPFDEEAPFIYPGGTTLFFASNRSDSHCCFEIYSSIFQVNGTWTMPINSGFPAKSPMDNKLIAASSEVKKSGSSTQKESAMHGTDNYMITFISPNEVSFTLLKGKVVAVFGKLNDPVKITVTDNETGIISNIYYSNDITGHYAFILPSGMNSVILYEGKDYVFQAHRMDITKKNNYYEIQIPVQITTLIKGSTIALNTLLFDSSGAQIQKLSDVELNAAFLFLSMNPKVVVELQAFSDNCENNKSTVMLLQERMHSIANYLIEKGINKNQIITNGDVIFLKHVTEGKQGLKSPHMKKKIPQRIELKIVENR